MDKARWSGLCTVSSQYQLQKRGSRHDTYSEKLDQRNTAWLQEAFVCP